MRKTLVFARIAGLLFLATFCSAQEPSNTDIPDKAEVIKFLNLMHARERMVQVLDEMSKQFRLGAERGFKTKVPNATPEQLAKVDSLFDGLFTALPIDDMVDAVVPIYQKHLTKTDLNAIIEFYSSSAGQKVLKEMPAILSESMQAGAEIGRKAFESRSQEFDQKVTALIEQAKTEKN